MKKLIHEKISQKFELLSNDLCNYKIIMNYV